LTTLELLVAGIESGLEISSVGDMVMARRGLDANSKYHKGVRLGSFAMTLGRKVGHKKVREKYIAEAEH
jgi:hypothetical protein